MDTQMKETDREPFLLFAKPFSRITLQRVKDKLLSTVIEVKAYRKRTVNFDLYLI